MTREHAPNRFGRNLREFFRQFPDFGIRLTQHARDRMRERVIELPQIRTVLERGSVRHVEPDIKTGLDKYRVVGRDADGRTLEIVVNLDETGKGNVTVITAIDAGSYGSSTRGAQGRRGSSSPGGGKGGQDDGGRHR